MLDFAALAEAQAASAIMIGGLGFAALKARTAPAIKLGELGFAALEA